jgi:sucrose-6-phosphate hydrolase SacC (GH32 family)
MVLYVGLPGTKGGAVDEKGRPIDVHTIHFLTSPDLKDWRVEGRIAGFFECPDLFELPVDGEPGETRWVLTAASGEYMVGTFDGATFTPETPKLKGHRGRGFYAAQTFSDIPAADGRRIQIGWLQARPRACRSTRRCRCRSS